MNGRLKIKYNLNLGWEIWTVDYKLKKKYRNLFWGTSYKDVKLLKVSNIGKKFKCHCIRGREDPEGE